MAKTKVKRDPRLEYITEFDEPDGDVQDRKTVFKSDEVAHRWAGNHYRHGRAGNVYFDGAVIYSYGRHFPMGAHQKNKKGEKFILLTYRTYSSSTAQHMGGVRDAVRNRENVFYVHDADARSRHCHRENLNDIGKLAGRMHEKAAKATKHRDMYLADANRLVSEGNRYAAMVGLRERLPELEKLAEFQRKVTAKQQAADRRIEKQQEERLAAEVKKWEGELAEWMSGRKEWFTRCPDPEDPRGELAYLRMSGKHTIQTSMGMPLKLKDVLPILDAVRGKVDPKSLMPRGLNDAAAYTVEGFTIGKIDMKKKVVQVGCHRVEFAEIERLAKTLKL